MRRVVTLAGLLLAGSAAQAQQTSNTTCSTYIPNQINCTTNTTAAPRVPAVDWGAYMQQQRQIQQQNQQNMNQAFQNLGAAIAARRERKRQEKALAEQKAQLDAISSAVANDTDVLQPVPTDEQPVHLICNIQGHSATVTLYEKHNRADTSVEGVAHTRAATFTPDAITWNTPVARSTINRMDGSYSLVGTFGALVGQSITGSCDVATARRF